jgi:hypothetical protein
MRATAVGGAIALLTVTLAARPAAAGGPVEITACTTITEPGSYVVVNNLQPAQPGDCLVIQAHFITIDLNGFVITGATDGGVKKGVGIGTFNIFAYKGVAIHHGTVTNFRDGVLVRSQDVRIERVRAVDNAENGIKVDACSSCPAGLRGDALIKDCIASSNGKSGIVTGRSSLIQHSVASDNAGDGIVTGDAALVQDSVASDNVGDGIVVGGDGGVVTGCVAKYNFGTGIKASRSTLIGNTASANAENGIAIECPSALMGNTALANQDSNLYQNGGGCTLAHNAF